MNLIVPAEVSCPYCGEIFSLEFDTSQPDQELVEDCTVCCRPILLNVRSEPGEILDLTSGPG